MNTDADFLERNRVATRTRRRVRLCFVALMACVIMMADLVVDADARLLVDNCQVTAPTTENDPAVNRITAAKAANHL